MTFQVVINLLHFFFTDYISPKEDKDPSFKNNENP